MTTDSRPIPDGTVTLVVDYAQGVQKTFQGLPWKEPLGSQGMAVTDALQAAASLGPGLDFQFAESFVDRGGREVGSISSIDGVGACEEGAAWSIFINERPVGTETRRVTPESFTKFGQPSIDPGDVVLLKLATGS